MPYVFDIRTTMQNALEFLMPADVKINKVDLSNSTINATITCGAKSALGVVMDNLKKWNCTDAVVSGLVVTCNIPFVCITDPNQPTPYIDFDQS